LRDRYCRSEHKPGRDWFSRKRNIDDEIRLGLKPELGTSKRPHLFEPIVEDTDAHLRFVELHLQSPPER